MKITELFEAKIPTVVGILKASCSKFLKEGDGSVLLRGIYPGDFPRNQSSAETSRLHREVKYFEMKTRKNRMPLNTPLEVHKILDDWFFEKFGWRARSHGLFTVGEKGGSSAAEYGYIKAIFPIGDFKFVWSEHYDDLYVVLENLAMSGPLEKIPKDKIIKTLEAGSYKSSNLKDAIASGHEIMIDCDSYFVFPDDRDIKDEAKKAAK